MSILNISKSVANASVVAVRKPREEYVAFVVKHDNKEQDKMTNTLDIEHGTK